MKCKVISKDFVNFLYFHEISVFFHFQVFHHDSGIFLVEMGQISPSNSDFGGKGGTIGGIRR